MVFIDVELICKTFPSNVIHNKVCRTYREARARVTLFVRSCMIWKEIRTPLPVLTIISFCEMRDSIPLKVSPDRWDVISTWSPRKMLFPSIERLLLSSETATVFADFDDWKQFVTNGHKHRRHSSHMFLPRLGLSLQISHDFQEIGPSVAFRNSFVELYLGFFGAASRSCFALDLCDISLSGTQRARRTAGNLRICVALGLILQLFLQGSQLRALIDHLGYKLFFEFVACSLWLEWCEKCVQ